MTELDSALRRIAKLEAALVPFAREADAWWDKVPPSYRPGITEPKSKFAHAKAHFRIRDLRRAKRLLLKVRP